MDEILTLTLKNRIKLCYEILTITSGHKHKTSEKKLSSFQKGYRYGFKDGELNSSCSNPFLRDLVRSIATEPCTSL